MTIVETNMFTFALPLVKLKLTLKLTHLPMAVAKALAVGIHKKQLVQCLSEHCAVVSNLSVAFFNAGVLYYILN